MSTFHAPLFEGETGEWLCTLPGKQPHKCLVLWDDRGFTYVHIDGVRQLPVREYPPETKWKLVTHENMALALQARLVNQILHRCVDLGWRDNKLCEEAGVSPGHWSEIRSLKKKLTLLTIEKLTRAVGLEVTYTFKRKPK